MFRNSLITSNAELKGLTGYVQSKKPLWFRSLFISCSQGTCSLYSLPVILFVNVSSVLEHELSFLIEKQHTKSEQCNLTERKHEAQ